MEEMTTALIMRRTAQYPPEALVHVGLITREECHALWKAEHMNWKQYWHTVAYS